VSSEKQAEINSCLLVVQLFTDTESGNDRTVALNVNLLKVCQEIASVTDHLEKAAARMMILRMLLKMLCQVADSLGENSDLDFRRTGVALMDSVLLHNCGFFCLSHFFSPHFNICSVTQQKAGENLFEV
jgi:hypothetical protein